MRQNKKTDIFASVKQMRAIDARTYAIYGISSLILMENAGQAVAREAKKVLKKNGNKSIAVICGSGNNAGDGFVAARYLLNEGYRVKVILAKSPKSFKGDCKINFDILKKLKADICSFRRQSIEEGVVIDAVFGTGISGIVEGRTAKIISEINKSGAYKISVDIPSGMDGDSGGIMGCAVKADKTVTFALLKRAFKNKSAKRYTGKIIAADIGIPKIVVKDIIKNEKN
ncbi:MAG: NAD(P)H-hydrate epimerase [Endomicrobium sp.]|jgi:NAD(P)H-hydrate epimerase|nr:NAD(P)H-hydrate epimerase [Endomicrobium sp.]